MNGVNLNPLQQLWLKEMGVQSLWGHSSLDKPDLAKAASIKSKARPGSESGQSSTSSVDNRRVENSPNTSQTQPASESSNYEQARKQLKSSASPKSDNTQNKTATSSDSHVQGAKTEQAFNISQWISTQDPAQVDMNQLASLLDQCTACELHQHRDQTVLSNKLQRDIGECQYLCITDYPSKEEDKVGEAMVGEVGELFDNILHALHIEKEKVLVAPMVKCHPFVTDLNKSHVNACSAVLKLQIKRAKPKYIIAFGQSAGHLLGLEGRLEDWRYQELWYEDEEGFRCRVIATHHPRYLLLNQAFKAQAWQDLRVLLEA